MTAEGNILSGMIESWRTVPGFPLYEVSHLGRVRSLRRTHIGKHWKSGKAMRIAAGGRVLKGTTARADGYRQVLLGRGAPRLVHRLVLIAFVGPCPQGMEGCHYDGDPKTNELSNLRWDTRAANIDDAKRHGTFRFNHGIVRVGTEHPSARLTEDDVRAIRKTPLHTPGLSIKYGVSVASIYKIRRRKVWKHVQ